MKKLDPYLVTAADIASASGLTKERVRQLKPVLQPKQLPNGQYRYRVDIVEAWLSSRKDR
jgi:hypothetical protein